MRLRWWRWLPWRYLLRRAAAAHGFVDPFALLARLEQFGQPSEVAQPIELLRAGAVFHARGLVNSHVIQHNLDWIWPYWVERQFDPADDAFLPRAFSITHVNLTNRSWTAIGTPDVDALPIVDPRGLLTPHFDGWSLDTALWCDDGRALVPARAREVVQRLELGDPVAVTTETSLGALAIHTRCSVGVEHGEAVCRMTVRAESDAPAWLVLGLRPYNPEGLSPVHDVALEPRTRWLVEGEPRVRLSEPPEHHQTSDYRAGRESMHWGPEEHLRTHCDVGTASAASFYRLTPDAPREIVLTTPLDHVPVERAPPDWAHLLEGTARLRVADPRTARLYHAALVSLVLLSPGDVYAGPLTYKRFWFRDAAFIVHGLLCAGLRERAERALDHFPIRQSATGYFHSQEGEWDSNGEALWILGRFCEVTGTAPKAQWRSAVRRGARWIVRKRLAEGHEPHSGLLPAGFSAEHLGLNDYYYWDDFWGVAGLRAAARLVEDEGLRREFSQEADRLARAVDRSLALAAARLGRPAMPASPYRRLDAGAVGSLAAGYPLQLFAPDDPRLLGTAEHLLGHCLFRGAFFQDVIHSGCNAYLTLHLAQVLLRAGDERVHEVVEAVADLASATGQWPEAVHPRTGGGCMGDGHHGWASAEWIMLVRNAFVREEGERLVLGGGVHESWLGDGAGFGPAPTAFGTVSVSLAPVDARTVEVSWTGEWHREPPPIEARVPGFEPGRAEGDEARMRVRRRR